MNYLEKPLGQPFIMVSRDIVGTTANETIIANCSGPENRRHSQLSWVLLSTPVYKIAEKENNSFLMLPFFAFIKDP